MQSFYNYVLMDSNSLYSTFKKIHLYYIYVYMCVPGPACVGAYGGQKKVPGALEQELL